MPARIISLQTRSPARRVLAVVGLCLAAVLPWALLAPNDAPPPPANPPSDAAAAPAQAALLPAPAPTPTAETAPEVAPVTCPHQRLELVRSTQRLVACASATRIRQTGSVRSLSVTAEGTSRWSLRVDTAGVRVVAARLSERPEGREAGGEFRCAGAACQGFEIGPPDRHGMRLLTARGARLTASGAAGGSSAAPAGELMLHAALQIAPDRHNPVLACTVPHVEVVGSDGGMAEFCPLGGAGFELSADEHTNFVFSDLEGRRLTIRVGADGALLRASHGALSCTANGCGGLSVQVKGDAADPGSQRTFSFAGTTFADPRAPGVSARYTGQLTMPAQE